MGQPTLAFSRAAPVDREAIFVDMDAKIASISLDAKRRRLQRDVGWQCYEFAFNLAILLHCSITGSH